MEIPDNEVYIAIAILAAAVTFVLALRGPGLPFAVVATVGGLVGFVIVGHPAFPVMTAALAGLVGLRMRRGAAMEPAAGWDIALQFLFIGVGLAAYTTTRRLIEGSFSDAHGNALRVIDFERALGLDFEHRLQEWLTGSDTFTRWMNDIYSFAYLPAIGAALLWLYARDRAAFRVLRNALGISTVLALITIALLPVAPPRLVPEAGMVDTVVALGREHSFANEYAAIPSFHVGWIALAGYAVSLTLTGWRRHAMAWLPGVGMLGIVIGTGNHYWIDGAVGVALAVGPALMMVHATGTRSVLAGGRAQLQRGALVVHRVMLGLTDCVTTSARAAFTTIALGALLGFLIAGELISPGFTDFWGYLVAQMAVTLVLLVAGEWIFRGQGGLSWTTHIVAVLTGYADTFGTAGDLYANIAEYDKVTHFAGVAVVTAGFFDVLTAAHRRGHRSFLTESRLMVAIMAGILAGVGWEVYEALGDDLFATKRVQGRLDTTYDLVFDTLGALVAGFLLARFERQKRPEDVPAWPQPDVAQENP